MSDKVHTRGGKTAFVLAGGGSLGALQVGMLKALVEADVVPDLIVGCSVGALNAAYFAGAPTVDGVAALEAIWRQLKRSDVFPMSWRRIVAFLRQRDHLVESSHLRRLVERHLTYHRIEDAKLPLHIVAADVLTGEAVVLSRGDIVGAVIASTAVPVAFAPVIVDDRMLCDGAVASNTPVRIAVDFGATKLIVLPTGFACLTEAAPDGALATAMHAITLLTARQLVSELEALPDDVTCHVVPTACPLAVSPFDFTQTGLLIDRSYGQAKAWLVGGGLKRSQIPSELYPHDHDYDGCIRPVVVRSPGTTMRPRLN